MIKKIQITQIILLQLVGLFFTNNCSAQIAAGYIGDVNIQTHPDVIFTEMFEQNTLVQMKTNWTDTSKVSANISFSSSVPFGSLGTKSLKLSTINDADSNTVTNNENTYLFKRLNTGITDSVFVRFYIKYNSNTRFHHSGFWIGGNNPANPWPGNRSGYKPAGDSGFHIGTEVRGTTRAAANNSKFGFYNYWSAMKISTQTNPSTGTGYYWGNEFINSNPFANINMSEWVCIEIMVKLNNPVNNSTGELAMWINGNKISHHGLNFPIGTWTNSNQFIEGAGTPFEGFLWRTNDVLKFNYLWLNNYITHNANGHVSDVLYDHIVVAKKYIGPIASTPMPLKFTSLTLNPSSIERGLIAVKWQTTNEINVSHFNIQRSENGKDFATVGKLNAENKSYNEYSFSDVSRPSTVDGRLYYRIEAVDKDGSKTYSITKQINIQLPTSNIAVYPNPAKDFVNIETKDAKEIIITDLFGRIVLTNKIFNTQYSTFNIQSFSKGFYSIKVVDKKGNVSVEKLVVQ